MVDNTESMTNVNNTKSNKMNAVKLILGTIAGIFFFAVPFKLHGEIQILYSLVSHLIVGSISFLPAIVVIGALISALGALYFTYIKKDSENEFVQGVFVVSSTDFIMRVGAALVSVAVYFKIGPEYIWNEYTGGLIVNELMPSLYSLFFLSFVFIPLLLDFGSMELFGAIFKPVFKPLFKLPGTSAILAIGSWVGSGTVGLLSVNTEYKKGKFTGKEASILILGFCTISLPASFIYTTAIGGLEVAAFPYFYLTLLLVGVLTTSIISRIPPLSRKPDAYFGGAAVENVTETEEAKVGIQAALEKAGTAPSLVNMLVNGVKQAVGMYIEAFPIIIFIATIALVATEYTPIFDYMAIPFTPVLKAIGLPEAAQAAPAFIIGFADLLLPFLAATSITSQLTKFVVCIVGVIQIICMSETGAIALKSEVPLKFVDLAIVVLIKTVIAIPIALLIGRMIGLT